MNTSNEEANKLSSLQLQDSNRQKHQVLNLGQNLHNKQPRSFKILKWKSQTRLQKLVLAINIIIFFLTLVFLILILFQKSENICLTPACITAASYMLQAADFTIDPCINFYKFACSNWMKHHAMPNDKSSISTFEVLYDDLQFTLRGILDSEKSKLDNEATLKAKLFYKSCLQGDKYQKVQDNALKSTIDEIFGSWPVTNKNWNSLTKIEYMLGRLKQNFNFGVLIEYWIGPDDRNSSVNIIMIDQATLGLPGKDYFLKNDSQTVQDEYYKLMVETAVLFGAERDYAQIEMQKVLNFEKDIAQFIMAESDRQDTGAIYNKMTVNELIKQVPKIDWMHYLNTIMGPNITTDQSVVVYSLEYLKEIQHIIEKSEPIVVHNYGLWRFIKFVISNVPGIFEDLQADFRKALYGITAEEPRWVKCVDIINKRMGVAVGSLYIKDHFNAESKESALEMIKHIRAAFFELLEENEWMDEETKQVAKDKAKEMHQKIAYHGALLDSSTVIMLYKNLNITENQFIQNLLNYLSFESKLNLDSYDKPVNPDVWNTHPTVVNAFYNPNKNDIVFPAALLQPPFYSSNFPKSLNFGGIGVVIGHEITHGFDTKGRQFDKFGNLKKWWKNKTLNLFKNKTQCMIDQYSNYILEDIKMKSDGKLTLTENMADNGGLKQAYRAFKKWEKLNGRESLLPGLNMTHDQLFFLNYAQIWCGSLRPQETINRLRTSVHSVSPIRVIGPLSNLEEFSKAFGCKVGSPMNPSNKCSVW